MLSQKHRLANPRLIEKLNKAGQTYKTSLFVFKFLPSVSEDSKFAVSISKKAVAKAVNRNKIKRQMTESLRTNLELLKSPIVCLIIVKKKTPQELDYAAIDSQIKEFLNTHPTDV